MRAREAGRMADGLGRYVGVGPVFRFEWLTASRRWQGYAQRALFVGLLLAALFVVANGSTRPAAVTRRALADLGREFYLAVVGTQLTLVLLAAPAATAGAICLDRARGTLTHLMVTDLSDLEIVLGKLASRLLPVLALVACALPVTSLLSLLGGVDPDALFGSFLVTIGVALLGCSLALVFSLWAGKTHEALLATYAAWGLWLLGPYMAGPLLGFLGWTIPPAPWTLDPYSLCFAPYFAPGRVGWSDYLLFLAVTTGLSLLLAALAVWRLRSVCQRERVRAAPSAIGRWLGGLPRIPALPGPTLDGNPVLWREWHRNRPSRWSRLVYAVYFGLSGVFSLISVSTGSMMIAPFVNGFQVSIGLLLLSVSAATSMAEERARGSLDVLMSTPLSSRSIVLGKWLGTFRQALILTVLPVLVIVLGGSRETPERVAAGLIVAAFVLAQGAMLTSLGLLLATWIPRLGRAVGLTITLYVAITVGWLFLVMSLFRHDRFVISLICASSFYGAGGATAEIYSNGREAFLEPTLLWAILYGLAAVGLLGLILMTYNRCLGRIEDGLTWAWGREFERGAIIRARAMNARITEP